MTPTDLGPARPPERTGAAISAGLKWWGLLIATVLALLLAAYFVQLGQAPCGRPLDPPPATFRSAWWRCPAEQNRFNRDRSSVMAGYLRSIHFSADGQHGGVVGPGDAVIATWDGGQTWQPQASVPNETLFAVHFAADGRRGLAVGAQGAVVVTSDAGQPWVPARIHGYSSLFSVFLMEDGKRGWAAGDDGSIVVTRDGGQTWQLQSTDWKYRLLSIHFNRDGERGWAVGADGPILKTKDGGQHWTAIDHVPRYLSSIYFAADGEHGWAVGTGDAILATDNGGASWKPQGGNVPALLRAIHFIADGTHGWAVGAKGAILATNDGGQSWQRQASGIENELLDVHFNSDGKRGWAVGFQGTIMATQDGGRTWQRASRYERGAAPWYIALATILLLTCFGTLGWRILNQRTHLVEDRIAFEAVADSPLERADQDLLGFSKIADAVAAFLRHERTLPSLTIAVTAAWGQGKSSMMGLMRARLKAAGAPTVWFNVWHHQKEPVLLAALLAAVVSQGIPPLLSLRGLLFRGKLVWTRWCQRPLAGALPSLLFFGGGLSVLYLAVSLVLTSLTAGTEPVPAFAQPAPHPVFAQFADLVHSVIAEVAGNPAVEALLSGEWARFVRESVGAFGTEPTKIIPLAIAAVLLASVFLLVTHFCRPFPANPGALLFSLGNKFSLSQAEDQTTLRQRFREHFMDVTRALQPRTLTIFIDDIDRCEPAKAAETLEAVNYLSDSGLCFVILGMAREIVEAQLGEAHGTLAERAAEFEQARHGAAAVRNADGLPTTAVQLRLDYARKYLKKLIQIEVPVPSFGSPQMQALLANRAGTGDAPHAQERMVWFLRLCDSLERRREVFWRILRFALPAMLAGWLVFQGSLWMQAQDRKSEKAATLANQMVADAEAELTANARKYVLALRHELAAAATLRTLAAAAPFPAIVPVLQTAPAEPNPGLKLAELGSRLREAERWLEQAEKAADNMKEHQRNGQLTARDAANKERREAQARLAALEKDDVNYQGKLSEAAPAYSTGTSLDPRAPAPAESPGAAKPNPSSKIPTALVIPIGLLLIVAMTGIVLGRDRYSIKEGQSYKDAVRLWQPVLLERDAMRAPREAKRFLNLSRYLTLRVNDEQYLGWSWLRRRFATFCNVVPPGGEKAVDEAVIVALTTLLMTRPKHIQGSVVEQFLCDPRKFSSSVDDSGGADEAAYMKAVDKALAATRASAGGPPWSAKDVIKFINAAGEIRHGSSGPREHGAR